MTHTDIMINHYQEQESHPVKHDFTFINEFRYSMRSPNTKMNCIFLQEFLLVRKLKHEVIWIFWTQSICSPSILVAYLSPYHFIESVTLDSCERLLIQIEHILKCGREKSEARKFHWKFHMKTNSDHDLIIRLDVTNRWRANDDQADAWDIILSKMFESIYFGYVQWLILKHRKLPWP